MALVEYREDERCIAVFWRRGYRTQIFFLDNPSSVKVKYSLKFQLILMNCLRLGGNNISLNIACFDLLHQLAKRITDFLQVYDIRFSYRFTALKTAFYSIPKLKILLINTRQLKNSGIFFFLYKGIFTKIGSNKAFLNS